MDNLQIRRVKSKNDILQISKVERSSFKNYYPLPLLFSLHTTYPDGFRVVEDISINKIVGYIIATLEWDNGHIVSIATLSEYRNKGVGKLLLKNMENYLFKVCNVNYIILEVRFSNIIPRKFYYKNNYVDKRLVKNYYDNGEDAILMIKKNPYKKSNNNKIIVNMW